MITRGERIAQKARNRERWRRIYRQWSSSFGIEWTERNVARSAQHGKLCSCEQCGNPRRHFGDETIQERRAALDLCER